MTTAEEIRTWFEEARRKGASHMIVVCDTYDHEDYPVFVMPGEDARERVVEYEGKNMQRVHEVYKIAMGWEPQAHGRAWNL